MTTEPVGKARELSLLGPSFFRGQDPPACVLMRAPASTGKRTLAEFLSRQLGVPAVDRRLFPQPYWTDEKGRRSDSSGGVRLVEPELSMAMVRDLIDWSRTAPSSLAGKIAIIRLDHERVDGSTWSATSQCGSALLKTLEEASTTRFILLTSGPVLSTIESRAVVTVQSGLLSTEDVATILYRISDLDHAHAREVAALGSGRVRPALAARSAVVGAREAVLGALRDMSAGDEVALAGRCKEWSAECTSILIRAATERLINRFTVFTSDELSMLPVSKAVSLLSLIHRFRDARPKILLGAVASAVMR